MPFFLGVDPGYGDVAYQGALAEVRLYTRALSASEVAALASGATRNAVISPAVQVEVLDANGNLVTNATDAITISIGTNPGGAVLGQRLGLLA